MLTVAITKNYVNGSLALNLTCLRTYTINSYYKCLHITKFVACFSYSTFYYHYIFSSFIFYAKWIYSIVYVRLSLLFIQTKVMVTGALKQHSQQRFYVVTQSLEGRYAWWLLRFRLMLQWEAKRFNESNE